MTFEDDFFGGAFFCADFAFEGAAGLAVCFSIFFVAAALAGAAAFSGAFAVAATAGAAWTLPFFPAAG